MLPADVHAREARDVSSGYDVSVAGENSQPQGGVAAVAGERKWK